MTIAIASLEFIIITLCSGFMRIMTFTLWNDHLIFFLLQSWISWWYYISFIAREDVETHSVQASFVDLIQDYNTVVRKSRVCQDLPEQTAIRHVFQLRVLYQSNANVTSLLSRNTVCKAWFCDARSPASCSRQSAPGSPPLFPECIASHGQPFEPPWWQPHGGAGWCKFCHFYKNLPTKHDNHTPYRLNRCAYKGVQYTMITLAVIVTASGLPAWYKYCGSCVVFPLPVSPVTTKKVLSFTACTSLALCL